MPKVLEEIKADEDGEKVYGRKSVFRTRVKAVSNSELPDRVAGRAVVAVAVRQGTGRIRVTNRIPSSYDHERELVRGNASQFAEESRRADGGDPGDEMTGQVAITLALGLAASVEDIARRRISNWIPAAALVCGFGWHATASGWPGVFTAVLGAGAGFGVFLIFYILGGMGGGDVKLMAGLGSLLGPGRLLEAALWTAAAGGLIALAYLSVRALRRQPAGKTAVGEPAVREKESIPYAPAIAIGAWLSLIPKS